MLAQMTADKRGRNMQLPGVQTSALAFLNSQPKGSELLAESHSKDRQSRGNKATKSALGSKSAKIKKVLEQRQGAATTMNDYAEHSRSRQVPSLYGPLPESKLAANSFNQS